MDQQASPDAAATASVDDVIITDELGHRPSRQPDHAAENRAMVGLVEELTTDPDRVLQRVADLVLELCHADSAGINVLERSGEEEIFRWHAAAGAFAHHLRGTTPRSASPCGTVINRNRALLFNQAERAFPALRGAEPRIYENLLVPWAIDGKATGTVWAIKHDSHGRFDAEDARLLERFARFAGAAFGLLERNRIETEMRLAALNLMEDALLARREAEQTSAALRTSEERYRTLFEAMDEAYAVIEVIADGERNWVDFRFLEVNPAFVEHTGMEYPVGRTATELLGTPNPRWAEIYGRVAETGEPVRFEERELTLDRIFDLYVFRLGGPERRRVAVLFTNVTARKRAEEALRESEQRFRALVNATSYAVYRMSPDWTEMRQLDGRGFVADTAIPSESWLGQYIHADDQPRVMAAIQEAIRTRSMFELEHRVQRLDGTLGWTLSRAVPLLDENGEITEWFGAASDVTARKETEAALRRSEERFRTLFESIDQGFCIVEVLFDEADRPVDYRFQETNPAFEKQTGIENATGRRMREIEPRHEEHWFEIYGRIARTGAPERFTSEAKYLGERIYDVYAFRVGAPEERKVAILFKDVTEQKRAERELRELNETLEERVTQRTAELERANAALGQQIEERIHAEEARREALRQLVTAEEEERRRISRELHDSMAQLVTALSLRLGTLARDLPSPQHAERIEELERLAERIGREMQQLALELRPPALDNLGLSQALQGELEEWRQLHGLEVDFHGTGLDGERLPPEIETTLYRIVQEGLTNVLKHAQATHVSLVLERRQGLVRAILEDDGRGFVPEDALAAPDKSRRLGLRGMRERVALLGGEFEIESSRDSGTTLFVRIPLQSKASPSTPVPDDSS